VNHQDFPVEIASLATSLREEVRCFIRREDLLVSLLHSLDTELRLLTQEHLGTLQGVNLLERFAGASSWVQGKRVRVGDAGGYTGVTDGLDAQGFLRVSGDDGVMHTVLNGGVREQ
jgi:BirA family biotin operon repressor/biotin-[acetyl-CoA-carboxylase] ligase